jgi:hypothetical protein
MREKESKKKDKVRTMPLLYSHLLSARKILALMEFFNI